MKHAAAHYDRADEYVDFARRVLVVMSSLLWISSRRGSLEVCVKMAIMRRGE